MPAQAGIHDFPSVYGSGTAGRKQVMDAGLRRHDGGVRAVRVERKSEAPSARVNPTEDGGAR